MERKEIITKSDTETQELAKKMAQEILEGLDVKSGSRSRRHREKNKGALVIGLEGYLGSGKTTFIQGVAQGLGIKDKITSPTFVIMKKYGFFYHIDCYRIESKDLLELGFKEIIGQPDNIVMIEWAERVKDVLPKNTIWMKFEYLDKNKRKIIYENISSN